MTQGDGQGRCLETTLRENIPSKGKQTDCVESVARDAAWRRRRGLRRSWRLRGDDAEGTAALGWKAVRRNSPSVYSRQKPTVHILSSIGMRVGRVAGSLGRGAPDPRNPCGVAGRLKT